MTIKKIHSTRTRAVLPTLNDRASGVLLHLSSLPGSGPIGDLGQAAYAFVDLLSSLGQRWWQMLPVNPVGAGNSPYSTVCSFAGEPLLISLEQLVADGLLKASELPKAKTSGSHVNFDRARKQKLPLLRLASQRLQPSDQAFKSFCQRSEWLDDYAMFMLLAQLHGTACWSKWPEAHRQRDPKTLAHLAKQYTSEIHYHKFTQYVFAKQWKSLKTYAAGLGVALIGDLPIFVSFESSDVWSSQQFFCINTKGEQEFVAGVPPDYFNKDGQRWGNALYRWDQMKKDGFTWWIRRFSQLLEFFDCVRIDHFIGFYRYWEIPASAKSAKTGTWRLAPGDELFAVTQKHFGKDLPFIAEDLGLITPEVIALRDKYQLPSMKVLQFGYANDGGGSSHRPHHFIRNCVVYTGTHDNDTSRGWYEGAKREAPKKNPSFDFNRIQAVLKCSSKDSASALIDAAFYSVAKLAIIPWQDVLGLDAKSRMNTPGTPTGNWEWRFRAKDVKAKDLASFKSQTSTSDRARSP